MQAFDRLQNVTSELAESEMRSMPYEQYFGEMELSDEQKEERISLAERFEQDFLFILSLIVVMQEYGTVDWDSIKTQLQNRYKSTLSGVVDTDDYINDYIDQFSSDMIQSTQNNAQDPCMTSYDRARYMAENESNTIYNHKDLMNAIAAGKTRKRWVTMRDKRVRKTHRQADGQTVGIKQPFFVGDSAMLVPKDSETYGASPQECINCRCTVKYF